MLTPSFKVKLQKLARRRRNSGHRLNVGTSYRQRRPLKLAFARLSFNEEWTKMSLLEGFEMNYAWDLKTRLHEEHWCVSKVRKQWPEENYLNGMKPCGLDGFTAVKVVFQFGPRSLSTTQCPYRASGCPPCDHVCVGVWVMP